MPKANGDTGEIRLNTVIREIQSDNKTERSKALRNLKEIFDKRHGAENLDLLKDNAYHSIFEAIFKVVLVEKQSFLGSKKNTSSQAFTRLNLCADAIRVVIKAGASKLKARTLEAIVDHIIQTLPNPNGEYCEPLADNYIHALTALVDHAANVERLKVQPWTDLVGFCLEGLDQYLGDSEGTPVGRSRAGTPRGFQGHKAINTSELAIRSTSVNREKKGQATWVTRKHVENLLYTLISLVSASNAPLIGRTGKIASSIIHFLQSEGNNVSQLHQSTFSIMNTVILFTREDSLSFSQSAAQDLVPIISRFWQGKSVAKDDKMLNSVRDEMLAFLFNIHLHLEQSVRADESGGLASQLEHLLDILRADYAKRSDQRQLRLEDVDMSDFNMEMRKTHPFQLYAFRLRPHNLRAERNWAVLQTIGILERLISLRDKNKRPLDKFGDSNSDQHTRKRPRLAQTSDRLLTPLKSEDENVRLAGLQITSFMLQQVQLSAPALEVLVSHLVVCVDHKKSRLASWALLAIARQVNSSSI